MARAGMGGMTIVYEGGPYAGQDDYLLPPPKRLGAPGREGHYQRTREVDPLGRIVYQWVGEAGSRKRIRLAAS